MLSHSCLFLISAALLFAASGCDTRVTDSPSGASSPSSEPAPPPGGLTMTEAPLNYGPPGADTAVVATRPGGQGPKQGASAPYFCLVSTLQPEGADWAYRYQRFDITLSEELLEQVSGPGHRGRWYPFYFSDQRASARPVGDASRPARAGASAVL